jgi:hypothetical protein
LLSASKALTWLVLVLYAICDVDESRSTDIMSICLQKWLHAWQLGNRTGATVPRKKTFDLYAFVAGAAIETGKPFPLECNCGAVVTIMPPFDDEHVVCARCEATIKMLVIEGDPGYIIGQGPDGQPTLLPVQGSSMPHPSQLSSKERKTILAGVKDQLSGEGKDVGES